MKTPYYARAYKISRMALTITVPQSDPGFKLLLCQRRYRKRRTMQLQITCASHGDDHFSAVISSVCFFASWLVVSTRCDDNCA